MVIIGILFIAAGLGMAYFADEFRGGARVARFAGLALVLIGLGAIAVDVFDLDADAAVAHVKQAVHTAAAYFRSSWGTVKGVMA